MYRLTVRFQGKLLHAYEFDKPLVTIGRSEECDVIIDNLGVSRVHAQVERIHGFLVLRDLNSNNGTFVRGQRIRQYNLNHNDEFFIGKHCIAFENLEEDTDWGDLDTGEPATESIKDQQAMTMSMDSREMALMQKKMIGGAGLAAYLTIHARTGVRKNVPVSKTITFFGRFQKCDYALEGWFINKRHAAIVRDETGFTLYHLAWRKPPRVNGKETDKRKLRHGDRVQIANLHFTFNLGSP